MLICNEHPSGVNPMAVESGSAVEWASWLAALLGLWVLVSPFALGTPSSGSSAYWSDIAAGVIILVLAAYVAYQIRSG